jgi:tetratricopeptide (TPR) repeat protein
MATDADIAALQGNKRALAQALMRRGAVHADRKEVDDSIADERAAIAADADNATAHAILALGLAAKADATADAEADRAISLDPKQAVAWRAKGGLAFAQKRYADADTAFSRYLEAEPDDAEILATRGLVRTIEAKFAEALIDADKSLAIGPSLGARVTRATALGGLGRKEESLAEADRAVRENPDSEAMLRARGMLRANFGETKLAIEDYDALLRRSPKVDYYLSRAQLWTAADQAKKNADIAAALALDPHSAKALALRASNAINAGDFRAAEVDIAALEKSDKDSSYVYEMKLQLLQKQDRRREALQLVDAFIARHPDDSTALNERCWTKATFNVELQAALADCNASLKLQPNNPATLDSRAFTNLRLGATDAAISDYDAALKLAPALPASLFGRAIARAKKGDVEGARADLAQARKYSPDIEARFAAFGVSLPASLASAN